MTDITIPPEAVKAFQTVVYDKLMAWLPASTINPAMVAAINAWPGMFYHPARPDEEACIFLPLPKAPA